MAKERLDIAVFEAGLSESREKARALVMEGKVYVDGQKRDKPGMPVPPKQKSRSSAKNVLTMSRGGF
jgi:23S rRNA (cytidine1920-2'-O)/16S rRNA (cytidine1409-2'-O)-methyltransferase